MEMKVQVPFQQLLTLVRKLTPKQKARLRQEINGSEPVNEQNDDFIKFLLNGPVYSGKDIDIIEENRNSIKEWRTKD